MFLSSLKTITARASAAAITLALAAALASVTFATESNAAAKTRVQSITASQSHAETLSQFIGIGLSKSPAVRTKHLAWEQALQRQPQATTLPDPVLSYTQPIHEIETRLGPNKRSYMVSQGFPFPGTLKTKGQIARSEVQLARLALTKAKRTLILDIKKAFFDLYYLDKAAELAKKETNLLRHLTKARKNDYSVDSTGFSDVIKAETRLADANYDQILINELREAARTRLNTLLNRDPEKSINTLADIPIKAPNAKVTKLYKKIKSNEDILASAALIEKSRLKEKLARKNTRPRFTLALNYTEIGTPETANVKDGGKDAVSATIAVSLPIWTSKNKGARAEARLARLGAEQAKAALINDLNAKTKTHYIDMQSNYRLLKLYSDSLIPKAERLMKTAEAAYKNGEGSLSNIFEPRIMRIQFQMAYWRATTNYQKSRAELEKLTAGFTLKESTNE